jgi:hypothetical protein
MYLVTRKDAKCSDVITALKPTTGTNAARSVPRITCRMISWYHEVDFKRSVLEIEHVVMLAPFL